MRLDFRPVTLQARFLDNRRSLPPSRLYNVADYEWRIFVLIYVMVQESASAKARFEEFGRKLDQHFSGTLPRVEEEVKKVISYLNEEVVPQVRQNSSQALRIAAEHLARLAEYLDKKA
jgi:hypothetical protein